MRFYYRRCRGMVWGWRSTRFDRSIVFLSTLLDNLRVLLGARSTPFCILSNGCCRNCWSKNCCCCSDYYRFWDGVSGICLGNGSLFYAIRGYLECYLSFLEQSTTLREWILLVIRFMLFMCFREEISSMRGIRS
jgi:hypothetical protein